MLGKIVESVIANGETESDLVDLENVMVVGLIIPTLNSTALTFKVASEAIETPVTLAVADLSAITISSGTGLVAIGSDVLDELTAYRFVRIVAGTAQNAKRTFKWVTKVWTG